MKSRIPALIGLFSICLPALPAISAEEVQGGKLASGDPQVRAWWALSSAEKILPTTPPPDRDSERISLQCARNEWEAVQVVLCSEKPLRGLRVSATLAGGPGGAAFPAEHLQLLQVKYVSLAQASDRASKAGAWPDPLLPVHGALDLNAGSNHVFWLRVYVPKETPAGKYRGKVRLQSADFSAELPLDLVVYGFTLPDRMTCQTAFGFSPGNVYRYHGLKTEEQKRQVLEKYLANFSTHHVSPYDPVPLDPIKVTWPDIKPPRTHWDDWSGLRLVNNEVHNGSSALLIYDDQPGQSVTVAYEPLIRIPPKGMRLRCWYRTAVPGHRFILTFNHHDANRQWMSGRNNDLTFSGNGEWQLIDEWITNAPTGAAFFKFNARATVWSDSGEHLGLVWLDDLTLTDNETGGELIPGGDFERRPRQEPVIPREQLVARLDFSAWDRAMENAMNRYHFNSFRVNFPGLGGGTFHEIDAPQLLGFGENDPEYVPLMASYGSQLEAHLRQRGWLDYGYVYWFDEPSPDQYAFVMGGFAKLRRFAPGLTRMLTEQVEPGLINGPNLWCPITDEYRHEPAEARRQAGEKFWWYVCTGPKAPYAGLFIDHAAPEMRIWAWQTWQRGIQGLLVWETTYWTSGAAYPDRARPQNPYEDPMSWTSGYSTPAGERRPWGNGDGRFLYPPLAAASGNPSAPVLDGPVDSIRWEHLRDGIEDYEYLAILRKKLDSLRVDLPSEKRGAFLKLLEVPPEISRSMTQFAPDGTAMEIRRREVAKAIDELAR